MGVLRLRNAGFGFAGQIAVPVGAELESTECLAVRQLITSYESRRETFDCPRACVGQGGDAQVAQHSEGSSETQKRIAYSVSEVAQQTGLSEPFIRLEIKRGNLRASRVGRRVAVLVTAMDEWLNEGTWVSATRRACR
jgi:excisionase family DNA binding protein